MSSAGSHVDVLLRPLVTVIVPSWNSANEIKDFLESLSRQTYPRKSVELIVIDNGSTDGTVKAIREWYASQESAGWHRLELIALSSNQGIAHAYNLGYKHCSPSSFAIMRGEADVVFEADLIDRLCSVLTSEASIGVAGARGLLAGIEPPKLDHAASYVNWWIGRVKNLDPPQLVDCDSVLGPAFMVRRSCIDELSYFFAEERFFADELEFCTRVKRSRYRVVCEPAAVAYHKGARSAGQMDRTRFGYIAQRETVLFYLEYNSFPQAIVWLIWNSAYALNQALKGQTMPLCGLRDGIRWWMSRTPPRLPGARNGLSLCEWLAGS